MEDNIYINTYKKKKKVKHKVINSEEFPKSQHYD